MKKFILLTLILFCLSCDNEDDTVAAPFYTAFLEKTVPQFNGNVNGSPKIWQYGWKTYQMGSSSYATGATLNDRVLSFSLYQENGNNYFSIRTPEYNISSEEEFASVFGLGSKQLGQAIDKFNIEIIDGSNHYNICETASDYTVEIVKTQEIATSTGDRLRVWFKIDRIKSENCSSNAVFDMKNVMILGEFFQYKNF